MSSAARAVTVRAADRASSGPLRAEAGDLLDRGDRARACSSRSTSRCRRARAREKRHGCARRSAPTPTTSRRALAARAVRRARSAGSTRRIRAEFARARPALRGRDRRRSLPRSSSRYAGRDAAASSSRSRKTAEDVFGARAGDVLPDTGLRDPVAVLVQAPGRRARARHDRRVRTDGHPRCARAPARGARRRAAADRHDRSPRRPASLRARRTGIGSGPRIPPRTAAAVEEAIEAIRGAIERAGADRRQANCTRARALSNSRRSNAAASSSRRSFGKRKCQDVSPRAAVGHTIWGPRHSRSRWDPRRTSLRCTRGRSSGC